MRAILGSITVAAILAFWQLAADNGWVKVFLTSTPSRIVRSGKAYYGHGGAGWTDLDASGKVFLYGFLISVLIGVPLGILMGWYASLDALVSPVLTALNNSPRIALAPLFVIWFGLGVESKVWIVVLSAIVPIVINARAGVVTIEPTLLAMSRSFGSSDLRLLRTIVLPGTVPAISSGLRLGIANALMGVVLAEFIAASHGLGFVIFSSASAFDTDRLFVGVVTITAIGMVMTGLVGRVEKYFERWRTA